MHLNIKRALMRFAFLQAACRKLLPLSQSAKNDTQTLSPDKAMSHDTQSAQTRKAGINYEGDKCQLIPSGGMSRSRLNNYILKWVVCGSKSMA